MRAHTDRAICVSAGACALTATKVFDQGEEDGRVVLLTPRHTSCVTR